MYCVFLLLAVVLLSDDGVVIIVGGDMIGCEEKSEAKNDRERLYV